MRTEADISQATGRIKSDITSGQSDLASTESIYSQSNPPVIKEYLAANDEDKQLFELTFKAFKTNTQLKARSKWYEWKAGILENIRPDVEEVYNEVKDVSPSSLLLPSLRIVAYRMIG